LAVFDILDVLYDLLHELKNDPVMSSCQPDLIGAPIGELLDGLPVVIHKDGAYSPGGPLNNVLERLSEGHQATSFIRTETTCETPGSLMVIP